MLASFSLKAKLIAICAILAFMTAVLGFMNRHMNSAAAASYEHIAQVNLENMKNLGNMRVAFKQARLKAFHSALPGLEKAELQVIAHGILDTIEEYEVANKHYTALPFEPGEEVIYRKVARTWNEHRLTLKKIAELLLSDDPKAQQQIVSLLGNEFVEIAKIYDPAMRKLTEFQNSEAMRWKLQATETQAKAQTFAIVLAAGTVLSGLLLGFFISRSLSETLGQLSAQLAHGAGTVASAARQISNASVEASSSTAQQAAALQQTVASIDEVSAVVSRNAENARRSVEASNTTRKTAQVGKLAIDEMLRSMKDISLSNADIMMQTEESNQEIFTIVKIINEIELKTKVINDIVFQTKLLSFNASVEAARAGEHGKGFAVVAEEVGKLARMSGLAAKEIDLLLNESVQKVEKTVSDAKNRMERLIAVGRTKIDQGAVTAQRCGESLDGIVQHVNELNRMVEEIANASREQASGVGEISKALVQIDQGMQQASSVANQSAMSSEDLSRQALHLDSAVGILVDTVYGTGRKTRPRKVPTPMQRQQEAVAAENSPTEDDPRLEDI